MVFCNFLCKSYSKLRPHEAGYKIINRIIRFGSTTKTARHVKVTPYSLTSSRSNIFNLIANSRLESSIIGYGNVSLEPRSPNATMSSIHCKWDSAVSIDNAIGLTFLFWNSGYSWATRANSVVHTGVKSAGCENNMPQLKPRTHTIYEKKITFDGKYARTQRNNAKYVYFRHRSTVVEIKKKHLRGTKPIIKINFTNRCVGVKIWKNITNIHCNRVCTTCKAKMAVMQ